MTTDGLTAAPPAADPPRLSRRIRDGRRRRLAIPAAILEALGPGLIAVTLMLVWAAHDGGYDTDTWYWGALVLLMTLAGVVVSGRSRVRALSTPTKIALLAFGLYVAWSFLSITWAESPGQALQGSNRALLFLIVFALMTLLPWNRRRALLALALFGAAIGTMAVVILVRFASSDHVSSLLSQGRLAAPAGYFNSTAALFTIAALLAIGLSSQRALPALARGGLAGCAAACLQLAVACQSRGWLFTLPVVALLTFLVVRERVRFVLASLLPAAAAIIAGRSLVAIFGTSSTVAMTHAARTAGQHGLALCGAVAVAQALAAWSERAYRPPAVSARVRRGLTATFLALVVAGAGAGMFVATHGDPGGFIARQWRGFSHTEVVPSSGSYFATVGSGRYDFWRVGLDAFLAHPVGGLGQDNFTEYYLPRRHTGQEPTWTHSLEIRLLVHTGLVGFLLFAVFIGAALSAAFRARRTGAALTGSLAGLAVVPLVVWLVHGSVDWFWEVPALTGPALGFLGLACGLAPAAPRRQVEIAPGRRALAHQIGQLAIPSLGIALFVAAAVSLGLSYVSVREVSAATDVASSSPTTALRDLATAARLNPLDATPDLVAGEIALSHHEYLIGARRFGQAVSRDPGSWFAWLGRGLAASGSRHRASARRDFEHALSINNRQPVISEAARRANTPHPLSYSQAIRLLVVAP